MDKLYRIEDPELLFPLVQAIAVQMGQKSVSEAEVMNMIIKMLQHIGQPGGLSQLGDSGVAAAAAASAASSSTSSTPSPSQGAVSAAFGGGSGGPGGVERRSPGLFASPPNAAVVSRGANNSHNNRSIHTNHGAWLHPSRHPLDSLATPNR